MTGKIHNAIELAELRRLHTPDSTSPAIHLCSGAGCIASGAGDVKKALEAAMADAGLSVPIRSTGCLGPCAEGPVIMIMPEQAIYERVTPADAESIITGHFIEKRIVNRLTHHNSDGTEATLTEDIDFFRGQKKVVLRNCGRIDPTRIEEYIGTGGYSALAKVLSDITAEQIIETLKISGLRGRGGAGFPTWLKWDFTRKASGETKYVLCNADEGDPGAFMDRSVLEGDPHCLIEGMAIAARTVGATQGFIYVRAEYPLAVSRLDTALQQAREANLLGTDILGTGFTFDLAIRMGSGAFVCGEETALIASIEGKRGEPRPRPPFPAQRGLWDCPTLLNNVETYANITSIINQGAEVYAETGTEGSPGTKVFALAGAIQTSGLVEVPVGTSLGELIYEIGGGVKNDRNYKAAQIGGPSGGCIPKEHLSVSLDYDSLSKLGAIMGSGGLIVMDEETCMVDVARYFLEFVQEESCGKCVPCRVGTKRMLEILTAICEGRGKEGDIERLIELGTMIKETSLCGLGQTAPNPVLSTIRYFRKEYEDHIRNGHCEAGVCPGLVRAPCQSACPANVDIPGFVSLIREKRYAEALKLHRERNPFAAVCARVCFHTCENHCRRSTLDEPVSIRGLKRFLVEQEVTIQTPEIRENPDHAKRKIAIIGAGPAGLSCGYFLARMGYKPTIFEAEARPGGMLTQAIPAYRLPRETLAREVRMIERTGVNIETGRRLGRDFTLKELKNTGYEAVFLAAGAPENMALGIEGEDSEGVIQAVPFLREYNSRGSVEVGRHVLVIGGGNAAVDAARTAIRLDAESVTILYRRTQEQMPAYAEEIEEALHEGVKLRTLVQPVKIISDDTGKAVGIRCLPMSLGEYDRTGRRGPKAAETKTEIITADQIIIAIGQRLEAEQITGTSEIRTRPDHFVDADPVNGQTSLPWIFAGGDMVSGPSSVVSAIGAGERAAVGIDTFLNGESNAFWRTEWQNDTRYDPDEAPEPYPREKLPTTDVEKRRSNFDEVELCWTEASAMRQSSRCLRCDYGKSAPCSEAGEKETSHA